MGSSLVELAAEIVKSQCVSKQMSSEEIASSLQNTFNTLHAMQASENAGAAVEGDVVDGSEKKVDITPARSIQKNKIICLECGEPFKMLSPKHLKSHGLTGREYRKKHGFSLRQPLCARSLSEARKKAGKERGVPDNLLKSIAARKKKNAARKKTARKAK